MPRKATTRRGAHRRVPRQQRARLTVDAVLDAVVRILKREGVAAVTTNRIAEVAGVSVGSIYQYFPDKQAIFIALHKRHVEEIDRLVERTLVAHASVSLADLIRAMVGALIDTHALDPELYELLASEVPHRSGGTQSFSTRLRAVFRLAIAARLPHERVPARLDRLAFVVAEMVDALSHAAVLRRPSGLSLATAREETVRAVMAYLGSA